MAVSKRMRFEVLRRDGHTCRYCGASAPDVELTVDHVVPVALGGDDKPANLVAACVDCNAGKSSSSPDQELVDDVEADDVRWSQAMARAAEAQQRKNNDLHAYREDVKWMWEDAQGGPYELYHEPGKWRYPDRKDAETDWAVYGRELKPLAAFVSKSEAEAFLEAKTASMFPLPDGWHRSLHLWMAAGITTSDVFDAALIAVAADHIPASRKWRYCCGIVWNKINEREQLARDIIEGEGRPDG